MAIAKKGLRKMVVDEITYGWKARFASDWTIDITIAQLETGAILTANLLHHRYFGEGAQPPHPAVAPGLIRQLIDHACTKGWDPLKKSKPWSLGNLDHLREKGEIQF